jgi:hypothetical protein
MSSEKKIAADHVNGGKSQVSASGEILDRIAEPRLCVEAKNLGGLVPVPHVTVEEIPRVQSFYRFWQNEPKVPCAAPLTCFRS